VKKAIAIFVSVLFVFALASLSFAVEKKAATAPAAVEKKEAAPVKAEEKAPVVKVKRISGEVVAVDATAGTLTVKSKKQEVSLSTDDKTVVKKGLEKKALADVVAGDKVLVKYKEVDGKNVAKSVAVK
jgi:glucose dehydrogenase